ncbi:MAG TPA: quinone oxidoreductase [Rhodospirillales bacterium]|nr:quinone oxidoreductase [Rhodospirillales bacterium]
MRAIQVLDYGEAETLTTTEIPRPVPGDGEAQVQVAYAGVNFIDVYMRRGMYANNRAYATSLPLTLGMEGAGIVTATGPGVNDIATGDRVAYCLNPGSYAEFAVVPTWKLVKLPRDVSLAIGAAIMLQGCTAHYLSHTLFPLASGHTCLVHAGAGGVGQLLIQLAKMRGARVLTTVGNDEKADIARRRGADEVILYRDTDFRQAVMAVTGGEGVDVVYESVGRETFDDSILSLKHRGTCVLFGASSGAVTSMNPQILADAGSVFLTRPNLADYMASREEIADRAGTLFDALTRANLDVAIDGKFPLANAAEAQLILEERKTTGKLVLEVDVSLDS